MTIQIAQRIGRALGVRSATRLKELDTALREYVRSVPTGATLPIGGSIGAGQVVSGTFADARISQSSVTQHEAALSIDWLQLDSVPATFTPAAHTHGNADLTGYTAADVLAKLLTVDGAGSGIDADLLDGLSSAAFATTRTSGTWTPADTSGAGLALTVYAATWQKHEDLVIARASIQYPATADVSNNRVGGLPFTVANNDAATQAFITYDTANLGLMCVPDKNATSLRFYVAAGGGLATNVQLSGKQVVFTAIYPV